MKTTSHQLICADNHIVFDQYFNEIFVKDLYIGDYIQTEFGIEKIIELYKLNEKDNMYDLTIKNKNHRYYTNRNFIS